ncbi:ABC transporter permease [Stenotrophomonas tumulicola]|uniref:Transport permease protein n=1 Tax=Stenotrophomonas tumulicola TaxID=1685415 RepID=A0A7W3FPW4_9GAMM|nr:ABC transporter permease [Stenotrophomonas tumulicola]MBA8683508.1 ABC transporter permease [Stenotrophomonas tumulicola]
MNALATSSPRGAAGRLLAPYVAELKAELRRAWRTPAFVLPCLLFPVLFYLVFGVMLGNRQAASYLLATYCVFGAMGPALFGFGVQLAMDRATGLLTLKRALPVPPLAPLLARMLMAVMFAMGVAALLMIAAMAVGGVPLVAMQMVGLLGVAALVALPLGAVGMLIGCHVGAEASPAVVNLVYLPLALLSGLWIPLSVLPVVFSSIAPLWPTWHAAQLALPIMGHAASGNGGAHVLVLLAVTVVFALLAARRLRRIG